MRKFMSMVLLMFLAVASSVTYAQDDEIAPPEGESAKAQGATGGAANAKEPHEDNTEFNQELEKAEKAPSPAPAHAQVGESPMTSRHQLAKADSDEAPKASKKAKKSSKAKAKKTPKKPAKKKTTKSKKKKSSKNADAPAD